MTFRNRPVVTQRPLHHHSVDDGASAPIWHSHAMPDGDATPYRHALPYRRAHALRSAGDFDQAHLERYVEPEPVRRSRPVTDSNPAMVIVWLTVVGVAAAVVLALLVELLAAPRSGQTTGPVDVSGIASAAQSGAPHGTGPARRATGGAPSSPAVVLEATSEGLSGLTTPMPASLDRVTRQGTISHNDDATSTRYLALPVKRPFITVEICGPAACRVLRQTDYGPSQRIHPDRIADVSPAMFEVLCGVPARMGLCPGSWTIVTKPGVTLPPTSTEEE